MARETTKKPTQRPPVEVVRDTESGVEVTVYYDRGGGRFYAQCPSPAETYRDKDLAVVLEKVREHLAAARSFDWKPAIVISHGGGPGERSHGFGGARADYRAEGASLSFSFYRCELAPKPGAKPKDRRTFVQRPHTADVEDPQAAPWVRAARAEGRDTHDHYASDAEEVVPYTEEAWAALRRLKEATERTYEQLRDLFKRPELLLTVAASPRLLVGGGGRVRRHPQGGEGGEG